MPATVLEPLHAQAIAIERAEHRARITYRAARTPTLHRWLNSLCTTHAGLDAWSRARLAALLRAELTHRTQAIAAQLAERSDGEVISDQCARDIAMLWNFRADSALGGFASTGAITADTRGELDEMNTVGWSRSDAAEWHALRDYLHAQDDRDAILDWTVR